jgi:hypothetical protein
MNCDIHKIPLKKRILSEVTIGKPLWYCDECEKEERTKEQIKEIKKEKVVIEKSTSLGKDYNALGISDWEEVFPKAICNKCYLLPYYNKRCAAINVIKGLAIQASFSATRAQVLVTDIKDITKALS